MGQHKFTIPQKIKRARIQKQYSQLELAKLLSLQTAQHISNIERGLVPVSIGLIPGLCFYLELQEQELIEYLVARYRSHVCSKLKGVRD